MVCNSEGALYIFCKAFFVNEQEETPPQAAKGASNKTAQEDIKYTGLIPKKKFCL